MAELDYLKAALPDRVTILGQRLLPFSLGHLMILLRTQNSFITKELANLQRISFDLFLGVFICCQSYEEALASLASDWLPWKLRLWQIRLRKVDVVKKAELFRHYIDQGSTFPDLSEADAAEVRLSGAPFLQRVRLLLQSRLSHSLTEAWNKPWGEALHDYFAFWEMEKKVRILNEEEKALLADKDGSLAALDAFLQTPEFKNFLAKHVRAQSEFRPLEGD